MRSQDKVRIVHIAVFIAAASALQAAEALLPHPIPWIRLGLANALTLFSLIIYGPGAAFSVSFGRILIGSMLSGSFLSPVFYLSLSGGLFSTLIMTLIYRPFGVLSPVGVSMAGAVSHNFAQLIVAYLLMGNKGVFLLSPILILTGSVFGFINGYIVKKILPVLAVYADKKIYLASTSPQRKEFFLKAGVPFIPIAPEADEPSADEGESPSDYAKRIAEKKMESVKGKISPPGIVITADTLVECGGRIMGKPISEENAEEMLRFMSGEKQRVYTAISGYNLSSKEKITEITATELKFKTLTESDIENLRSKNIDKAGAYGIQSMRDKYIEWIRGSYSNVVGLPMGSLRRIIRKLSP